MKPTVIPTSLLLLSFPVVGHAQLQTAKPPQSVGTARPVHRQSASRAQESTQRSRHSAPADLLAAVRSSQMLPPPDPVREAAEFEVSRKYHDFLKAGDDLLQQGDSEGAIAQYRQGLEVKPDPGAWIKIGDILWQQGKQQAAIDAYRAAVNVPPASISAAHEKLGDAYAALGRDDDAILEYQTALTRQIDKQDYFKLALLYVKHRQFEQAGLMYNQGMHWMDSDEQSVFPSSFSRDALGQRDFAATAHVALGLIRSGYGYDDEAITEMRTALRLQPDSAVVHYFLAQSLQKKGGRQGHSVLGIR